MKNTQQAWSFFLFLFVLLSPTVAYLLTVLLLPNPLEGDFDSKQHFYNNHRWFFTLAALLPIIDAIDTGLKGWIHFATQGLLYILTILLLFTLSIIAAVIRRVGFHEFFDVLFNAFQCLHFITCKMPPLTRL